MTSMLYTTTSPNNTTIISDDRHFVDKDENLMFSSWFSSHINSYLFGAGVVEGVVEGCAAAIGGCSF